MKIFKIGEYALYFQGPCYKHHNNIGKILNITRNHNIEIKFLNGDVWVADRENVKPLSLDEAMIHILEN